MSLEQHVLPESKEATKDQYMCVKMIKNQLEYKWVMVFLSEI